MKRHIVLSPADAAKVGIDTDELRFDRFCETANGTVRGSSIRIADFRTGGIHLIASQCRLSCRRPFLLVLPEQRLENMLPQIPNHRNDNAVPC